MRNFLAITVLYFVIAPVAKGQQYSGTVLYPLSIPNGYADLLTNADQSSVAGQTVGSGDFNGGGIHALLWSAPDGSVTDLNPAGFTGSFACSTDGIQQVGFAYGNATNGNNDSAMLWSGTAASAIDLNPAGFYGSIATEITGNQEVGEGDNHAMLWTGTAASAVDLNPAGFSGSEANNTDGKQQVGYGWYADSNGNNYQALLWSGTAASAVNLNPTGFTSSNAVGNGGNQQVGYGSDSSTGNNFHALLWTGTAASAIDLNPVDITYSNAIATNGVEQVGWGGNSANGLQGEALLWSGTAASAVNLQPFLPLNGAWEDSYAISIDANNNVFGVAFGTLNGVRGYYAVEWSLLPEPAPFSILVETALIVLHRRRPHRVLNRV